MVEVSQSPSCPQPSLSQGLGPGWKKGLKKKKKKNLGWEWSVVLLLQKKWNDINILCLPPSRLLEPAPLPFSPLSCVIIAWLVHTIAQLATKWLCFFIDHTCDPKDFSNKKVNIQQFCPFESHPLPGSLLTSFVMSLATDFLAAWFDPFWIVFPWMSSCLKGDLKWVLLHVRAIGWKERYLEAAEVSA